MIAMSPAAPVRAVLFDLDGTLVDSEIHTDAAIRAIAKRHGVASLALPHTETRGRTWEHVADEMQRRAGLTGDPAALAAELLQYWNDLTAASLTPVPGAPEAVHAAARRLRLGVVSSSPRTVIDSFVDRLGIGDCIESAARIGCDAVARSKPDPEGFLMGARALGVAPGECLVFEDSRAGLEAARAAGMRSVFVTCCAADVAGSAPLATARCTDYRSLPPRFWDALADGGYVLGGEVFA